jgi:hypothetical protein
MEPVYYSPAEASLHQFRKDRWDRGIKERLWSTWRAEDTTPKFPPQFRRDFFGEESDPSVRAASLDTEGAYQSFAFISDGVIHQLSFPSLKTNTRHSRGLLVGSISDELDDPQLVTLPGDLQDQWIVSAVDSPEMNLDGLDIDYFPTLTKVKPDLVPGPYVYDGNEVRRAPPRPRTPWH